MVLVPINNLDSGFSARTTLNRMIATLQSTINVRDYGAVGNGTTDDTAAIQAAITACVTGRRGGTVYAPTGTYRITSTITLPDPDGGFQNSISIRGDGPTLTTFSWQGASTGAGALMFDVLGQAYCSYRSFRMVNATGAGRASTRGFWFRGDAHAGGTTGGSVIFEHVSASGFNYGMLIGDTQDAISEVLFFMPIFDNCNCGLWAGNFNTLDLTFVLPQLSTNAIGIQFDTAGCAQFLGGSASNSTTTDFYFNTGGSFLISGFRSEGANRFLQDFTGKVHLDSCTLSPSSNADKILITAYEALSITNCTIYGKIGIRANNSVSITNSEISNGGDAGDQLLYPYLDPNLGGVHLHAFGNRGIVSYNGAQRFSDRASIFDTSNVETRAWTMGTSHP